MKAVYGCLTIHKTSDYDQEMPQSMTVQPTTPRGRDTEHRQSSKGDY